MRTAHQLFPVFVITTVLLVACQSVPPAFKDPVAAMTDPSLTLRGNVAAMHQAAETAPDDPRRIDSLKNIMSEPGSSLEMRKTALLLLIDHDEADARQTLMYRLPSINAWDFMEFACDLVGDRGWKEFTASLVRSLARPQPVYERVGDRPESKALLALHPGKQIEDIVFDVVAMPVTSPVQQQWRLSAWDLLNQIDVDPARLGALLSEANPEGDPMLADLKAGALELGVVPRTRDEVQWLRSLREPENADWWSLCRYALALVSGDERPSIELRHLAVILAVQQRRPEWLTRTRGDLVADLSGILRDREVFSVRTDTNMTASRYNASQKLTDCVDKLAWADLLTLRLGVDLLEEATLREEIFLQAERDRGDPTTEYGGILDIVEGRPIAIMFTPRIRANDAKFMAPLDMESRGHTGLFHYHFHVQEPDNSDYAGPGVGDRQYADAMGVNCIVFTSIRANRINADYYQRGGIVVDLGTFYR